MFNQKSSLNISTLDVLKMRREGSVLAIISRTNGPSYRPVGAVMQFFGDGSSIGSLSSGCIEADLAIHAKAALSASAPKTVLYGEGSPFIDIQLPCGGGLEIILLPQPDQATLTTVVDKLEARQAVFLGVHRSTGALSASDKAVSDTENDVLSVRYLPEPKFVVFGKGPEAATFSALVDTLGYPNILLSPDIETLSSLGEIPSNHVHLTKPGIPHSVTIDRWSAVVLFFHDHEWEPPILMSALESQPFYIGAQGSERARRLRDMNLVALGAGDQDLERIKGPIGVVRSARDPRTLAASVLAEVLQVGADLRNPPLSAQKY